MMIGTILVLLDRKPSPSKRLIVGAIFWSLNLTAGWKLISIPVEPVNTSIDKVLENISGKYQSVWAYDNGWKRYIAGAPSGINDLDSIRPGKGYWIKMTDDCSLMLTGNWLTDTTIPLKAGWNLVGYKGQSVKPIESAISSINNDCISVWGYDNGWKRYIKDAQGNNLLAMEPGKGYWINVISDCIWDINSVSPAPAGIHGFADSSIEKTDKGRFSDKNGQRSSIGDDLEIPPLAKGGRGNLNSSNLDQTYTVVKKTTLENDSTYDKLSSYQGLLNASIPEIPFMIYGTIVVDGVIARAETKPIPTVVLKSDGKVLSNYRLGSEKRYGELYVLELPALDSSKKYELYVQFDDELDKISSPVAVISSGFPGQLIRLDLSVQRIPQVSKLGQNYPNPFNPDTWIPYQMKEDVTVKIRIYSSNGQLVRTLDLGYKPAGYYTVKERSAYWDGRNESGEPVASGIYFYSIQAGKFTSTKKMVIMR